MEMQGVWFPNFISRHRPHLEYGVAPFPSARGVPAPRSLIDADVIAIPRGCKHPEAAKKFLYHAQTRGLAILCRLQGKHMPVKRPPELLHVGHPNLHLDTFEKVAAAPDSFILPRIPVWMEYHDRLSKAFEHVWSWPVPDAKLKGLTGEERRRKIESLCEEEIRATLERVRDEIQTKLDSKLERLARRRAAE